ncbi:MAG: HAMP domain-containing sensor histidine kinase [Ilumatobacteraceae bacterium]
MHRRLIVRFVAVAALLVLALALPLGWMFARSIRTNATDAIEDEASAIAISIEQAVEGGQQFDVVSIRRDTTRSTVRLTDAQGRLVRGEPLPPDLQIAVELVLTERPLTARIHTDGDTISAIALASTDERIDGAVVVTQSGEETERTVRLGWLVLAMVSAGVLGVAAGVARQLAAWIAQPLDELGESVARFGDGDLTERVTPHEWPPDIEYLGSAFNEMADRIERLVDQNESFVHEASHQLRTPLTGLRLRLENLAAEAEPGGAAELQQATAEVDRLSRLTSGLLSLARAERHSGPPAEPVDVVAMADEVAAQWHALGDEYGIEVHAEHASGARPLRALAARDRLTQVLDNVVANAFDASDPGTSVVLRTGLGTSGEIVVEVVDEGHGMSDDERTRAFERFWTGGRIAGAPDPDTGARLGGTGLGLPIAARLLRRDGATIELHPGPSGRGTLVRISLRSC